MRKAKQLAGILLAVLLLDYIFFQLDLANPKKEGAWINRFYHLAMFFLFLVFFFTVFYRTVFSLKSSLWVTISSVFLCFMLAIFVSGRLKSLMLAYDNSFARRDIVTVDEGLQGFDNRGLWRGNPNAKGYMHYNLGDTVLGKVEVVNDSLGNKSVQDSLRVTSDTLDMFIGCSFSYGQLVKGEEGYPYLVTKAINHRLMNASMCGYGLAQMQMRLDSLLPVHKFRYVFIQLSPWLSERSKSISGIFTRGYPAVHYYARTDSGVKLMPQAYESPDYKKMGGWYDRGRKYSERLRFYLTTGYVLQVQGYLKMRYAQLKVALGIIPGPITDKLALEKAFYEKAVSDVRRNGGIPVIFKIYWGSEEDFAPMSQFLNGKALVVDCDRRLDSVAKTMGVDRSQIYRLYVERGGKRVFYDNHPNSFANRLIADEILLRIGEAR